MEHPPRNKGRETLLTFTLVGILGGAIVFFLNMISMGIFVYVIAAVLAFGLLGLVHYAMWGQGLTEATAGEREEEEIRAKLGLEDDQEPGD